MMEMSGQLYKLVQKFIEERPTLELPGRVSDPLDTCRAFAELARKEGLDAEVLAVKGYRGLAPIEGMDEEEVVAIEHAVVEVDGAGYDFSFRQLNHLAKVPTVYDPVDDLAIDWSYRRKDPDGEWEELPGPDEFRQRARKGED